MNIRETLPVHAPSNQEIRPAGETGALEICGLVARPRVLSAADLAALPRERLAQRFVCEEGWAVERLMWEGIPLHEVLALCAPLPEARYVRVCAGTYWLALPLDELDRALLCDRLNDAPLAREHGAPWRLVLSGGACFTSVKWVSQLELAAVAGAETAERIARDRLAAGKASG
jgi:DMSO/TMAO reductase YedYZ molybdopterin-dependent catalytic subunit